MFFKVFKRAGAISTGKRKKHMSPKIRRAQQDVPPSMSGISTLQEVTTSAESSNHEDKEHKGEAEPDAGNGSKEAEKLVSEEAVQMSDVKPKGAIPEEGSEKPAEDCPKAKEPLPEGEPSVASRLMSEDSREGEADNLSMEGVVMSEDEPELRCDKGDKVNGRFFSGTLVLSNLCHSGLKGG